jgi:hypothetical protein
MKLTLDTDLCSMASDEVINSITDFLTRSKLPFVRDIKRDKGLYSEELMSISYFYIGDGVTLENHRTIKRCVTIKIHHYRNPSLIHKHRNPSLIGIMLRERNVGALEYTHVNTLKDILYYISKHMSVLVNRNVFKKINANNNTDQYTIDQSGKSIFKENINKMSLERGFNLLRYFLDKSGLSFNYDKSYLLYRFVIGAKEDIYRIDYDENIYLKMEESFISSDIVVTMYFKEIMQTVDTLFEVIEFISKYKSILTNRNVFKKINENLVNDSSVKRSFVKYVSGLSEWQYVNQDLYEFETEEFPQTATIEDVFGDHFSNSYTLYRIIKKTGTTPEANRCDHIDYYIINNTKDWHFPNDDEIKAHYVYQNGKFENASGMEDTYLRSLKDIHKHKILEIGYEDWKKNKVQTLKAIFKMNEQTTSNKDVKRSFIQYVNNLDSWQATNEEMYKYENGAWFNEAEEGEVFSDNNTHGYVLFDMWVFEEGEELTGSEYNSETKESTPITLTIDNDIDFFCVDWYVSKETNETNFHVYQYGKFREADSGESEYLRALDEEVMFGNQTNVMALDYEDWKKNRKQTVRAVFKMNEKDNSLMNFNKFKLIYKT